MEKKKKRNEYNADEVKKHSVEIEILKNVEYQKVKRDYSEVVKKGNLIRGFKI